MFGFSFNGSSVGSLAAVALLSCGAVMAQPNIEALKQQVADTERAFARSMADRDHVAFAWEEPAR